MSCTYTITFGNRAENHAGMLMIGNDVPAGFTYDELKNIPGAEIYHLNVLLPEDLRRESDNAYLVVIRNGIELMGIDKARFTEEVVAMPYDKKALMRGRVVNKHARHNNVIGDTAVNPNYAIGQGTIIAFDSVPCINLLRQRIGETFGPKAVNLYAETNKYYDINKTYIGYHGDTERKIVVAARIGATFPLQYQWYKKFEPVGREFMIYLNDGDIYAMSEKAVGFDWKKSSILTLRHGCNTNLVRH